MVIYEVYAAPNKRIRDKQTVCVVAVISDSLTAVSPQLGLKRV